MTALLHQRATYDDLLNPRWRGQMGWSNSPGAGGPTFIGNMLMTLGQDRGMAYVEQLSKHPKSGSIPKELRGLKYRQIVEPPCRVFYRIAQNRVVVLHVMRGEMHLPRRLLGRRQTEDF